MKNLRLVIIRSDIVRFNDNASNAEPFPNYLVKIKENEFSKQAGFSIKLCYVRW